MPPQDLLAHLEAERAKFETARLAYDEARARARRQGRLAYEAAERASRQADQDLRDAAAYGGQNYALEAKAAAAASEARDLTRAAYDRIRAALRR